MHSFSVCCLWYMLFVSVEQLTALTYLVERNTSFFNLLKFTYSADSCCQKSNNNTGLMSRSSFHSFRRPWILTWLSVCDLSEICVVTTLFLHVQNAPSSFCFGFICVFLHHLGEIGYKSTSIIRIHWLAFLFCLLVTDCRVLEGLQRYSSIPTYLPVNYQLLNADLGFFLKEANQDFMRNSTLVSRTEPFFIYQARSLPSVNASYGPLSVEQPVPLELLQSPGTFPASSLFTFNWKVQTFIMNSRIHLTKPKVQVLFYVAGRDWDDYSAIDKLPCVHMFAFHETQEVRGTCQLRGELGLCVAELEPLASWFSPPSVVPGRQRNHEVSEGTPVELYYVLQSTDAGCHSDESRKDNFIRTSQEGLFGSYTSTPLRRIGGVRLYQNPTEPPLAEHRLDNNFMVLVPATPMRQRETGSAFITVSAYSPVEMFTLR